MLVVTLLSFCFICPKVKTITFYLHKHEYVKIYFLRLNCRKILNGEKKKTRKVELHREDKRVRLNSSSSINEE